MPVEKPRPDVEGIAKAMAGGGKSLEKTNPEAEEKRLHAREQEESRTRLEDAMDGKPVENPEDRIKRKKHEAHESTSEYKKRLKRLEDAMDGKPVEDMDDTKKFPTNMPPLPTKETANPNEKAA